MKYQNESCDFCRQRFEETDDVVVCPVCGTPQHRDCYEKNGGCVNAEKHESGFVWKSSAPPQQQASVRDGEFQLAGIICPDCGRENPTDAECCESCGRKFTFMGVNYLEKEGRLAAKGLQQQLFQEELRSIEETFQNGTATLSDVDRLIDLRAKAVAPGMTKEQEQEVLCSHPIKRVLVFIAPNAVRYANKFRKTEATRKSTWNWAAFLFGPIWFFYRKLYKVGSIFLTLRLGLSLISLPYGERLISAMETLTEVAQGLTEPNQAYLDAANALFAAEIPVLIIGLLALLLSVVSGLIADRLYKNHITTNLDKVQKLDDPFQVTQLLASTSGVNIIAACCVATLLYLLPNIVSQFM